MLLGFLALATLVNQIAFPIGTNLTTASTMALLFGTMPILVGVIGWRLGHERPHARHWLAAGVSFAGIALVAGGAQGGVSGALFAVIVLSETLTLLQAIGGAVIAIAVVIARSRRAPVEIPD